LPLPLTLLLSFPPANFFLFRDEAPILSVFFSPCIRSYGSSCESSRCSLGDPISSYDVQSGTTFYTLGPVPPFLSKLFVSGGRKLVGVFTATHPLISCYSASFFLLRIVIVCVFVLRRISITYPPVFYGHPPFSPGVELPPGFFLRPSFFYAGDGLSSPVL